MSLSLEEAVHEVHTSSRPSGEPHNIPCCVLVADASAKLASAGHVFRRGTEWWKAANVWDDKQPYSSVAAIAEVVEHHTGEEPRFYGRFFGPSGVESAVSCLVPGGVYVVQGWRASGSGHTFFMRMHPSSPGGCLVIESSTTKGLRIGGHPWRSPDWRPQYELALSRLEVYDQGLGIVRLWDV